MQVVLGRLLAEGVLNSVLKTGRDTPTTLGGGSEEGSAYEASWE